MANIYSFSPFGYEESLVNVEVDLRRGIPAVDVVGLADGAVKETRERVRSALINSGFEFPAERVLISLSPADLKKEGAGFDLPVALGILNAKDGEEGFTYEIDGNDIIVYYNDYDGMSKLRYHNGKLYNECSQIYYRYN